MSPEEKQIFLTNLDPYETEALEKFWQVYAHSHQSPPEGSWSIWLLLGGRGAGKTRTGAEWVSGLARGDTPGAEKISPIALVGETDHDVREVMIEGVSGILAAHLRRDRPTWIPSRRRLEWPSGVVAQAFSAEDPDSLRGPQFAAAWCDDLDPEHEPMNRNHASHMPQVVIDAFKAEGAFWGGDFHARQDPMHFQFASE